jgi:hypothetical protein
MRYLLIAYAALALGGCAMATPERDWPISDRWKVSETASPECLSAARRASKFCLDKSLPSDIWGSYTSDCTKAQWDYSRSCR